MHTVDIYDPKNYMIHKELSGDLEHTSDGLFMLTDYLEYNQWCDSDRILKLLYSCFGQNNLNVTLCAQPVTFDSSVVSFVKIGTKLSEEGYIHIFIFNVPLYTVRLLHGEKVKSQVFSDIQKTVNYVRMLIV